MAVDPERIRQHMMAAEESGRRSLGVREARVALCALAVVVDEDPHEEEPGGSVVVLVRAS